MFQIFFLKACDFGQMSKKIILKTLFGTFRCPLNREIFSERSLLSVKENADKPWQIKYKP